MRLLSALILAGWGLSLFRTILHLLLVHRLRAWGAGGGAQVESFVSIVIPARNEARSIERTLRAFLAQDYADLKFILVDARSTDGTGALARALGDPRLVVIAGEEPPPGWLGKPWAMQQGGRAAGGGVLLFVEGDVH